ncbi:MAG TPA: hypothetical protein VIQ03_00620 [Gammaproteobacteria bacterium]
MNPYQSIAFVMVLIVSLSGAKAEECLLSGKWKSSEKKTLENMARANLTEKQKMLLSDNFFGKLIVIISCKDFTTYYDGEAEVTKLISIKEEGNIITTEYYSEIDGGIIKRKAVLSGNCYSVELGELGFSEVFCKIE